MYVIYTHDDTNIFSHTYSLNASLILQQLCTNLLNFTKKFSMSRELTGDPTGRPAYGDGGLKILHEQGTVQTVQTFYITYIHTYIHTCIHYIHVHLQMHTQTQSCIKARAHTQILAHIQMHIHTLIYTHMHTCT